MYINCKSLFDTYDDMGLYLSVLFAMKGSVNQITLIQFNRESLEVNVEFNNFQKSPITENKTAWSTWVPLFSNIDM